MDLLIKIIGILVVCFVMREVLMSEFMEYNKEHPESTWMVPFVDSIPTLIAVILSIIFF